MGPAVESRQLNPRPMASRTPSLLTHYSRYAIGNTLAMAAGFVSFPITTRLLSTEEFGVMGYWDAWILLIVAALKFGAGDAMLRFYPHGGDQQAKVRYATNFVLVPAMLALVGWVIALVCVTAGVAMNWVHDPVVAYSAMGLVALQVLISHALWSIGTRELSGLGASINVIWRWLTVAVVLGMLLLITRSAAGVFVARLVAACVIAAGLLWWMLKNLQFSRQAIDIPYAKEGFHYGVPLALKEISNVAMAFIDRIMLKTLLGDFALVGIYTIGFSLASYVDQIISAALGQAWTPAANRIYLNEGAAAVRAAKQRLMRPLVYVCVGLATGVLLAGKSFVALLAGHDKAEGAAPIFAVAAVCLLALPVLTIANTGLLLERKSKTLFMLTLATAVCNVLLNLVLIPHFKVMGATAANCACQIGLQLAIYGFCSRELRCWPPLSVVGRALLCSAACVALESWLEPPKLAPFLHCVYTLGFVIVTYALPVLATDGEMRRMILRRPAAQS
ncbi:MAG: lipopolysaccharide biosynthesis protein [Aquabacterium sp.]|nr:MAG: lipopolysaccharide biosynthesis protein [Aquabacterium sp.]